MNMNSLLSALLMAALLACPSARAADRDVLRQEVETLFRLTHMEEKIEEGVQNVAQIQIQQDPELANKRDVLMAFLEKYAGWQAIHDELAEMYMQTFTLDELKAMNAFYITPAGQKVITVVPKLVQQRNRVAMQRLQEHYGELQTAIKAAK